MLLVYSWLMLIFHILCFPPLQAGKLEVQMEHEGMKLRMPDGGKIAITKVRHTWQIWCATQQWRGREQCLPLPLHGDAAGWQAHATLARWHALRPWKP